MRMLTDEEIARFNELSLEIHDLHRWAYALIKVNDLDPAGVMLADAMRLIRKEACIIFGEEKAL